MVRHQIHVICGRDSHPTPTPPETVDDRRVVFGIMRLRRVLEVSSSGFYPLKTEARRKGKPGTVANSHRSAYGACFSSQRMYASPPRHKLPKMPLSAAHTPSSGMRCPKEGVRIAPSQACGDVVA
ncbi:hypothetical protein ACIBI9_60920 [Nonomuraea sp. NPDC050451]|uniref:hypothetical protein n=1 Tax=Nonomuraea sp. NPDC050451 TaxID=3364364 RepID=UPI00378ECDFC